jgi:hypothetical protein
MINIVNSIFDTPRVFLNESAHAYTILAVTLAIAGIVLLLLLFRNRASIFRSSPDLGESRLPLPIMQCRPGSYEAFDKPAKPLLSMI